MREGEALLRRVNGGRTWEVRRLKRAEAPTQTNHLGSKKGHGFLGGMKPSKRRGKVVRFFQEAQGRRQGLGRVFGSPGRRKALKSEAHERWGLKEASKGLKTKDSRGAGSQTRACDSPRSGQRFWGVFTGEVEMEKKGFWIRKC